MNIRCLKVITGEIIIFEQAEENETTVVMNRPHALVATPQGPALASAVPWIDGKSDFHLDMPKSSIAYWFREDECEAIANSYRQATSRLDLSVGAANANVRQIR